MTKKVILFLSGFLLFFCFAFVRAEELQNTTTIPEISPIPILYEEATSTDVLISPTPTTTSTEQKDLKSIKDEEFLVKCSLSKCKIPIPTLREPDNKKFNKSQKIYLTGLTWNNTIIDVYVDGNYIGKAIVRNDEKSNIANFYIELSGNLDAKEHHWSVIAWSFNERDRSFVSNQQSFTILEDKNIVLEQKQIEETPTSTSSISEPRETIDIISQELDVPVSVDFQESTTTVDVTSNTTSSEEKNILVVDSELKSDENKITPIKERVLESEQKSEESSMTEEVQKATPSEELKQEIQQDLVIDDSAEKNKKKIGTILLGALVIVMILYSIIFRKKK
ncbi:MAG: hypothetical protein PHH83_04965 [Patescibacteria group bacterium]|nr:hypothetical protein [Patescibacteria group bacterium]